MTSFKDRENAFENQFAHNAETNFKIAARANRKLGQWAGELLGKSGDDLKAYELEVIKSDLEEAGHEDVIRKVSADMAGVADEAEIRRKLQECTAKAINKFK